MYIAVYGSLKKGKYNHYWLKDSNFIKNSYIIGQLYNNGQYPALTNGKDKVPVEIYEVSEDEFYRLNKMELESGYYLDFEFLSGTGCFIWKMVKNINFWEKIKSY